MHRLQSFVVCFLAVIGSTVSVSFINPCKPTDGACQKKSAMAALPDFIKGVPKIGLPAGDPIFLDAAQSGDSNFNLAFKDMKVTGISKCTIVDFNRNLDESTMTLVTECPLTATGHYTLSGKVLFIPAVGDGGFVITTGKSRISVTITVEVYEKGNEKHWKITKFDYNYDILDKASIELENLFGGDKTRAKPFEEVLKNSPNEIIMEVGGPIIKELIKKQVKNVNKFMLAVPISQLES